MPLNLPGGGGMQWGTGRGWLCGSRHFLFRLSYNLLVSFKRTLTKRAALMDINDRLHKLHGV